jgi:AcrR family transcriptional regulator
MNKADRIAEAACDALMESGLSGVTVGRVARLAKVSTALVHYHYATKHRLLVTAIDRLAARRTAERAAALDAQSGLRALDALWDSIGEEVEVGAARCFLEAAAVAISDRDLRSVLSVRGAEERSAIASRLPRLLEALGARPPATTDELAAVVKAILDGMTQALLGTADRDSSRFRAVYDAFWLLLLASGQPPRS